MKVIQLPLTDEVIRELKVGDAVLLSGPMLSARDAAHRRWSESLARGEKLPVSLENETIYYVGPCPTPPGKVIGSAGPTTSGRMDSYTPLLLEKGLKGMIGKGERSEKVMDAMRWYGAVYFAALGGAGALMARSIVAAEVLAYPDLGAEAVHRLVVRDFPVIVAGDACGTNLYQQGRIEYADILANMA